MRTMLIGFGLCGVILDSRRGICEALKELTSTHICGIHFSKERVLAPGAEFPSSIPDDFPRQITTAEYEKAKRTFFETDQFRRLAHPCEGAVSGLQRIYGAGHQAKIVVGAKHLDRGRVREWCNAHRLPKCEQLFTWGGEGVKEYKDCDIVVESDTDVLRGLHALGSKRLYHMLPALGAVGSSEVIRPADLPEEIVSVHGFTQFLAIIAELPEYQMAA